MEDKCRKKQPRMEWRRIQALPKEPKTLIPPGYNSVSVAAEDGFITVERRSKSKSPQRAPTPHQQLSNRFQELSSEEMIDKGGCSELQPHGQSS